MATTLHSPTAGRRRLRNALRHARDAAGLTQEQVATAMDWSLSKVIRIETGGVGISTNDLRQLLLLYRVHDPAQVSELIELARIGRQRPWWTQYKEIIPGGYLNYIGLEDECSVLHSVSPVGLPGLLQTEGYARAVAEASKWVVTPSHALPEPAEIAERVRIRMIRQRTVLRRDPPPEITTLLDEAVLRRQVGGPGVLKEQLLHLIELGHSPHITVQVLPFGADAPSIINPFVVLTFPDPADPEVVYEESGLDYLILDDPEEVAMYRQVFTQVRSAALAEEESLELIARVAEELG